MSKLMKLEGAKELDRALTRLGKKAGGKIGRKALRAGAKPILANAKGRAPKGEKGFIPPSLKLKAGKRSRKKDYINIVIQTDKGWFKGKDFYAAFVEFGHFVGSRKLGSARTWVPPQPFVRPAFDSKKRQAVRIIMRELQRGIESGAKR